MTIEYIDILDENGNPLLTTKPRSLVHKDGDWHKTVHVWIVNSRKEVLFQKRSPQKESFPGAWDISAAGHMSADETSIVAAVKELKEELGLVCDPCELYLVDTMQESVILNNGKFIDNEFSDIYILQRDVLVKELLLQESEVSDARFFPNSILHDLGKQPDKAFVPHNKEYGLISAYLTGFFA